MERRGGGVAGAGPEVSIRAGVVPESGAPVSPEREVSSTRRATSKDDEGTGTAVRSGASSRHPDQDGLEEGSASMSP
jgi:hypothetical protein